VIVALAAAAAVAALLVLGSSGHEHRHHGHKGKGAHHAGKGDGSSAGGTSSSKPVTVALTTLSDMSICLVPGHGRPLIDSQTLVSGTKEGPFEPPADNYRLDLESGGAVTLALDGKSQRVRSNGPASFNIDAAGVDPTSFKGPSCP
jgi:hypothetical protein